MPTKQNISLLVAFLFAFSHGGISQDKMQDKSFINDSVEISVPASFHTMPKAEYNFFYQDSDYNNTAVLADHNAAVYISVASISTIVMTDEEYGDFYVLTMKEFKKKPGISKWITDGEKFHKDSKYIFFKFNRKTGADETFNLSIIANTTASHFFAINFSCPQKNSDRWEDIFEDIIANMKIK